MDVISDLSTSIELTIDVTDQVKTNIDMFRTHVDIHKCVITSCSYCPDSLPDEAKRITKSLHIGFSRVTTHQPTSIFVYPFPPAPLQPQTVAYKQSAAFIHPSLNAFRQPPPSPPAGSCQQIYECEEVVPTRNYHQKRGFTHSTDYIQHTFTPAVKDTEDQIKKMRYETISPAPYTDEALPENILNDLIPFHQMN
ncbi:unnamed protein product [Mytilus edulis]|uniref:Uncharacterized protein n=1 Tax=Mytilus edulis TaxID=6550 RepID=A0A8S3SCT7_MYTED|nr:unnamed protein product [Mytilus edulis]